MISEDILGEYSKDLFEKNILHVTMRKVWALCPSIKVIPSSIVQLSLTPNRPILRLNSTSFQSQAILPNFQCLSIVWTGDFSGGYEIYGMHYF